MPALPDQIGSRETPEEIRTALEAIDPNAELIHLEGKKWWLGVRAPNPTAEDEYELASAVDAASRVPNIADPVERAMEEVALARELQMKRVMAAGFRPVNLYTVDPRGDQADPRVVENLHELVDDFRVRDYNYRTMSQAEIERQYKEAASLEARNRPRTKAWAEMARDAASDAYNYVMRGARSVLVGAFRGGD